MYVLLLFLDVRTFQGTIIILNVAFNDDLRNSNSLAWLQLSLVIENEVGIVIGGLH